MTKGDCTGGIPKESKMGTVMNLVMPPREGDGL